MNTENMVTLVIFDDADIDSITSEEKQMMLEFVDTTIMMGSFFWYYNINFTKVR